MIPILRIGGVLIASVQSSVTDTELEELRDRISEALHHQPSRGVIVDVSVLDVLDSFSTRILHEIGLLARLAGAEPVIVGIQPAVAFTLVQLGLGLEQLSVGADLDDGLRRIGMSDSA